MLTRTAWVFPDTPRSPELGRVAHHLGPLATLAMDPSVTDIFVLPDGSVFAHRGQESRCVSDLRVPPGDAVNLARSLIEAGGRHLDEASPVVDVRLAEGIRVHAALPPIALGGVALSIRFARHSFVGVNDLGIEWRDTQREMVCAAVDRRETILISGATGSGKTTLLGALLGRASPHDRIVVLEDVAELTIDHPHVVQLECRQANLEGVGEVTLDRLVRESLRMRPTRLVVGECRGAELRDLLGALTTGHRGGATTIHAQSLDELPARLEALAVLAGLSPEQLARQAVAAFDLLIHIQHEGTRQVTLGRLIESERGRCAVESI